MRPAAPPAASKARGPRTLLCAIARDEGDYLSEWAAFHLGVGFDRIVIYDNESASPAADSLDADLARRVEVRPWRTRPRLAPQAPAYNDCLALDGRSVEWMMFLDVDEFLNLKRHDTVAAFVADYAAFDGVALNWRMFGSAGAQESDGRPVLERFTLASPEAFKPNIHVKTIFKPRAVRSAGIHSPYFHTGARLANTAGEVLDPTPEAHQRAVRHDVAQVNHYFTKSAAEFQAKRARGRADVADGAEGKHRADFEFTVYDRNDVEDLSILRHVQPARG